MERKGQRKKFHTYEKPNSRELEGLIVDSWFTEFDPNDELAVWGWTHEIDPDIEFVKRREDSKKRMIYRAESELININP